MPQLAGILISIVKKVWQSDLPGPAHEETCGVLRVRFPHKTDTTAESDSLILHMQDRGPQTHLNHKTKVNDPAQ